MVLFFSGYESLSKAGYNEGLNGWWLLRLSAKILALLRLSVNFLALLRLSINFFQLRLTKKLKINSFCCKRLNINKTVFFLIFKAK